MKISILTPTYNRANLLKNLYKSILENCRDCKLQVEWLIMDDGSKDETKLMVERFISDKKLEIKYFYQENSGKMQALNKLVQKCNGDFIIECDSDDYFSNNAFETIEKAIEKDKNLENIYALVFLKYDQNGNNMGNKFPENEYESKMFDLYFKEGTIGEKALVFNSNIRKKYKYELENKEKFITEARLYHKMDLKYNVKCFNKEIMICEYREDGYSKNLNDMFIKYPYGYFEYFKEMFEQNLKGIKLNKRMYIYKHYILFSILTKQKKILKNVKGSINKLAIAILYIPGAIATKKKFKNYIEELERCRKMAKENIEEDKIVVSHVYKTFNIYLDKANSLKEKMLFWNRNKREKREVLKDVSLTIKKGEAVALIGVNGSGKSTLLKLMTKIIYPNKGKIVTNGKLTSLLELGAGFHPDFSGRENIYFNASIFGLTRKEIDERLEQIIEFSELGDYIDNPVRTYSSGMYMRLAFAVAINVDAEILLVDEILAVGDQHFQEKCIAKMKELKEQGKTMVFVTHSMETVKEFCSRAVWLSNGVIKMDGKPDEVIEEYIKETL